MKDIKNLLTIALINITLLSCSQLDRSAQVVSLTGLQVSEDEEKMLKAKRNLIEAKQSLKLAIIKVNLITKSELVDSSGRRKAVFLEAQAFSPILSSSKISPFHLFTGDPIFTKLLPEFYQFLDAIEYKKIPIVVDCVGVPDCRGLRASLKKQYKIFVKDFNRVAANDASQEYVIMLSSKNISLKKKSPSNFRTAFKYRWLTFPSLQDQDLKIEEWAALIPKVKEF